MSRAIVGRPIKVTGSPAASHVPPMKQPTEPAPRTAILSAATVGCDALIRQPQTLRRFPRLPKDVDRHSPARIPIAADPQPLRLHFLDETLSNPDGDVLMESAVVAVGAEEELEAL